MLDGAMLGSRTLAAELFPLALDGGFVGAARVDQHAIVNREGFSRRQRVRLAPEGGRAEVAEGDLVVDDVVPLRRVAEAGGIFQDGDAAGDADGDLLAVDLAQGGRPSPGR